MKRIARSIRVVLVLAAATGLAAAADQAGFMHSYKGAPYTDSQWQASPQKIPGKVMCAFYDRGGEGVAYHDTDAKNHGSGELNPVDGSYLNQFRMNEGVDTSYTKFGRDPQIDDNPFQGAAPPPNMPYVGWTEPGEWFNMTVDVAKAADYTVDLLYTSNRGGAIRLDVNGEPATATIAIESTYSPADPLAWRQWHHWNLAPIARVHLEAGLNVVTVRVLEQGNMNFGWLDFRKAKK
ncbi:MAG TPA: hypothetical protein VG267_10110 [Terracidiphilus sp.]|jgi:hypothetical protein|nr:hypothetical protein [Terracidiphilus sp.]